MAYITLLDFKVQYLGIKLDETDNDPLITDTITRAQKAVETYTNRVFEASADSTRTFTVGVDTDGRTLYFDKDICQFTTIKTNADNGTGGTTVPSTAYVTLPRNETPYYGIKLLGSANYDWEYTDDPEAGITVLGRWAWSITAPDDIAQATLRWAGYLYKQKDAQVFDTTAMPDAGVMIIPAGIPKDVKILLEPYVKRVG